MSEIKNLARHAIARAARTTNKVVPFKARRFIAESWEAGSHPDEDKFGCPVCQGAVPYFKPMPADMVAKLAAHDYAHPFFLTETLNFNAYMCPLCGASDRDRLYALYLRERLQTGFWNFLDFAPSRALSNVLRQMPVLHYRSADLYDPRADDKVDITAMPYEAETFDGFLCSHVLEHVRDDARALQELFRILRPGGFGIIMVPLIESVEQTLENPFVVTEAERWKWYGQDDHVRQYAKGDFVRRIEAPGFTVRQLGRDHFGQSKFEAHGIHPRSVLYVAEKPAWTA